MPNFKPMLAKNSHEVKEIQFPVAVQEKWDGERLLVLDGQFLSRSMKPITNLWLIEHLKVLLEQLPFSLDLDGEIQVNENFAETSGFVRKSDRQAKFVYHVFDAPSLPGNYEHRHKILTAALKNFAPYWGCEVKAVPYYVCHDMEQLMMVHSKFSQHPSLDGTITRRLDTEYKHGRATGKDQQVLKLKDFDDSEGLIVGVYERMHNTNEAQTNELGRTFRSSAQDGLVGTGMLAGYRVLWNPNGRIDCRTCCDETGRCHGGGLPQGACEDCMNSRLDDETVEFSVTATGDLPSREERWKNRDDLIGGLVKFQYQGVGNKGAPRFPTELGLRDRDDL